MVDSSGQGGDHVVELAGKVMVVESFSSSSLQSFSSASTSISDGSISTVSKPQPASGGGGGGSISPVATKTSVSNDSEPTLHDEAPNLPTNVLFSGPCAEEDQPSTSATASGGMVVIDVPPLH
ncbi:RING-H2 finger protein ATL60-like [Salvia divinorum]|uniref:RING-H2 finger protein ATL60-like n=1 Tax=Salvia divinorum TaxID=28513 RepID=A0ABD1HVX0_SALDI